MKRGLAAVAFGVAALAASAQESAVPAVADFAREPKYDSLTLSPGGDYLAAKATLADRSVVAVLDRKDMSVLTTLNAGRETYVAEYIWSSPKRIFVTFSKNFENDAQRYMLPELYAVDVDGENRASMGGGLIDALANDDEHVLIGLCTDVVPDEGCDIEIRRIDANKLRLRGGKEVARSPVPGASFLTDHDGGVRWAWATNKNGIQKVYYRADGEWELVNDEAKSGVEMVPRVFSRDGARTYLQVEEKRGPDSVRTFDTTTRKFETVLRHGRVDPGAWILAADGRDLVGAYFFDGKPEAFYIDPEAPEALLADSVAGAFPNDFARVISYSRDGKYALVGVSGDRSAGRYYLFDRKSGQATFLLDRTPWLDKSRLASMQPVTVVARDGVKLNGLLTLPRGQGPHPMIVNPHGGPHGIRDVWGWDAETQLLASRGYAVLKLDFRGSGGYGRAFLESGFRQWGRRMQDDLTDATNWAIGAGFADQKRVCIYGASYGGYAALMGVVREPDLYRCAVGHVGVYDLDVLRKWGDTHRSESGMNFLDTAIGKDAGELAANSPARRAKQIKAAVMLAHGGRDDRASPEHYRAMKAALDAAGKPYEDYFRSYEGHGLFDEKNRVEFYERLLGFFGRHIGPTAAAPAAASGGVN